MDRTQNDSLLSEFIAHTSADSGLAVDLLTAHQWNLQSALSAYYVIKGILPGEMPSVEVVKHPTNVENKTTTTSVLFSENDVAEFEACKKLSRGFSCATDNVTLVNKTRNEFAKDLYETETESWPVSTKLEIPDFTFSLPNISVYPNKINKYLQQDLIEASTLVSLEQAGRLNWWHSKNVCKKLWPLATTGDGNCLLHAASLGIWGFHDRLLTLRKALHNLLTNSSLTDAFYRRWRWQTTLQNKEAGLIFCEEEWENEWQNLMKISSTEPRSKYQQGAIHETGNMINNDTPCEENHHDVYESLEELHILVLAHVLRRPIIVIADTLLKDISGEPFAPILFGGIYLPLECSPSECHRSPLCLAYDAAHFSALVPMEEELNDKLSTLAAIPVTDSDCKLLPLQFAVDPGFDVKWGHDENDPWVVARLTLTDKEKLGLLNEYLDIRSVPVPEINSTVQPVMTENSSASGEKLTSDHCESDDSLNDSGISCTGSKRHKSKAARQLQTVAKQFGSIGKSMSKKLKRISNIAKRGSSFINENETFRHTSFSLKNKRVLSGLPMISSAATVNGSFNPNQVVVAVLHTEKKHEYQEEMIKNYLCSTLSRLEKDNQIVNNNASKEYATVRCINPGCIMYGTALTSYLCSSCYNIQKQEEMQLQSKELVFPEKNVPVSEDHVVTYGNSSFYTESDKGMIECVTKLPFSTYLTSKTFGEKNGTFDKLVSASVKSNSFYNCKGKSIHTENDMVNVIQESATS